MASINDPPPPEYHRRGSNPDLQVPISQVQRMSMEDEERPLPDGWVRQFDRNSSHHFYVDTRANPPRSIWVHPFEDPQWQREHAASVGPPPGPPPGHTDAKLRKERPEEKGDKGDKAQAGGQSSSSSAGDQKRGFFGKLKDDVIGTKEERAAAKEKKAQQEREMQARYMERRRLLAEQRANQQMQYPNSPLYTNYGYRNQPVYPVPQAAYGRQRTGFGGGGMGIPLLGGLAGGLLLGDLIGGGFDGGDGGFGDGGGGFDGGF
ncbi:hypothetical protein FRB94_007135 [Tulasnella sp. JGI-2019a]|nr:hypothetical protein FRB93_012454 [Tulasnella sp. JGI-2019a]KAG9011942.1 hypothetical protein FRB94_007135 [Tulasnella sp. JGI-2019a]KAG9036286.1 hypothetical protein FRB95_009434 [Tulasnella sp. JGI-2019a]